MITLVWVVLAVVLCGGLYAAARILARDDMPLSRAGIIFSGPPLRGDAKGWESSADVADSALAGDRSPESGSLSPRLAGETLAGATAGQATTFQVLYAMASAVNDAWLDRLFAGNAS